QERVLLRYPRDVGRTVTRDDEARELGPLCSSRMILRAWNCYCVVGLVQEVVAVHDVGQVLVVVCSGQAKELVSHDVSFRDDLQRSSLGHARAKRMQVIPGQDEESGGNFDPV